MALPLTNHGFTPPGNPIPLFMPKISWKKCAKWIQMVKVNRARGFLVVAVRGPGCSHGACSGRCREEKFTRGKCYEWSSGILILPLGFELEEWGRINRHQ